MTRDLNARQRPLRSTRRPGQARRHRRLRFDAMEPGRLLSGGITIEFNDSYDTSGFFAANPQAMTVLQEAGQILGSNLENSLAAITPGAGNFWTQFVPDPAGPGAVIDLVNPSIAANTIIIYVGGTSDAGSYQVFLPGYTYSGSASWGELLSSRGQTRRIGRFGTHFRRGPVSARPPTGASAAHQTPQATASTTS